MPNNILNMVFNRVRYVKNGSLWPLLPFVSLMYLDKHLIKRL